MRQKFAAALGISVESLTFGGIARCELKKRIALIAGNKDFYDS